MTLRLDTLQLVIALLVGGFGVIATLWGAAVWLFWPRVRETIDERVQEKCKPITDSLRAQAKAIARHEEQLLVLPHTLQSLDRGIERLTTAVEHLTETAARQGQEQSEMRGEMNAHFERRRENRRAEDRGETSGEYRGVDRRRSP